MERPTSTWAFRYDGPNGRGQATCMVQRNLTASEVKAWLAGMFPKWTISYVGFIGEDE